MPRSVAPLFAFVLTLLIAARDSGAVEPPPGFDLKLDVIRRGYDGKTCMVQGRAGIIPRDGAPPIVVVTMSPLVLTGSDVYQTVHDMRSDDGGKTWTGPTLQPNLGRRPDGEIDGRPVELACGDFWPKWHAKSGKLLAIGHTFRYYDEKAPVKNVRRETCYTIYDPALRSWSKWKLLMNRAGDDVFPGGAGCIQRYDLPSGEILLPVYSGTRTGPLPYTHVKVLRLSFDGETLKLLEEGDELRQDSKRGFAEPSITRFRDRYYLTIRHDDAGYVCTSDDGLHFTAPRTWLWDDGTDLGNYNTQTHWVNHPDGLFLVYTRRGANNDHVFRHRAPLFIAQVDPEKLRVIRATERIAVPERGARL
ncbi:MAG TPA: sialidase family protein, partial [Pirellulaceae bacterium]|nr:sialidase family protein [Pirellulaceae bacterium]